MNADIMLRYYKASLHDAMREVKEHRAGGLDPLLAYRHKLVSVNYTLHNIVRDMQEGASLQTRIRSFLEA